MAERPLAALSKKPLPARSPQVGCLSRRECDGHRGRKLWQLEDSPSACGVNPEEGFVTAVSVEHGDEINMKAARPGTFRLGCEISSRKTDRGRVGRSAINANAPDTRSQSGRGTVRMCTFMAVPRWRSSHRSLKFPRCLAGSSRRRSSHGPVPPDDSPRRRLDGCRHRSA